jgi:hypothetical protein
MARNSTLEESSTATRTGRYWWQRCCHGRTTDSCGPPIHGGEVGGARTGAVNTEALRGRRRLSERFFSVPLDDDLGSRLLLHVEGVMAVWFLCLVGDNGGRRWLVMRSSAAAESEVEQKRRGMRKEKERGGNSPQCRIGAPWHGQRQRPAVTGACALSAMSAITRR